jgi:enolase
VEAGIVLRGGARGGARAPAGASRGRHEALDLRDGGSRFGGFDVTAAIASVEGPIARALRGRDAIDQAGVDRALIDADGTSGKTKLGGNATVATSLAAAHAAAAARRMPLWQHVADGAQVTLPLPEVQIFGGGAHAGRRIDIQDLMVMPVGATSFGEALAMVAEIYRAAGELMQDTGKASGVADEGGYWPLFDTNDDAIAMLVRAIERAGFAPGHDAAISLDIAASEFGRDGRYRLAHPRRELSADGMAEMLLRWLDRFPIASIEDPFAEDDPVAWQRFNAAAGARVQIIGDDLLVTSADRVAAAAADRACNAVLIKPNQAGTITEARAAMDAGVRAGFATIVSARSGETEDVSIAHLAVGWNAGQIKVGSFARGERMAKWNELLRIEEALGGDARYAGAAVLSPRHAASPGHDDRR